MRPDLNGGRESDDRLLRGFGYEPQLSRRMSGFSNFAISLSIICILAGGITSFHVGLGSVGGGSLGVGWPLACLFSLAVASTMAQVASAFPTAGGLYHWASILGGRGCGWTTAWFNLAGLVTVLATVNAGTYDFALAAFQLTPPESSAGAFKLAAVIVMVISQGLLNHIGIRWTTVLTDLSGWLILFLGAGLTVALVLATPTLEWSRLWTFGNFSGASVGGAGFPRQESIGWLFALGLMLPAYTITGFDASAHTAEETVGAAVNVPRGIVRSVWVSGLMGWGLVVALTLAMPSIPEGVAKGAEVVPWVLRERMPQGVAMGFLLGVLLVQYLCGLAALTSASRMVFAFARDGGLPASGWLRRVNPASGSPAYAVWTSALGGAAFTVFVPYATIAVVCTSLLYVSYVIPVAVGGWAWGRTWTVPGPWHLGRWFRPMAAIAVAGCLFLLVIGVQPPNELALRILGCTAVAMFLIWFLWERNRFRGPPVR